MDWWTSTVALMAGRVSWVGSLIVLGSGVEVMVKKYRMHLTEEEQEELKGLVSKGRTAAYRQTHARILLLSDEDQAMGVLRDEEIARALKVGTATVERVRRRCVEEGLEAISPKNFRSPETIETDLITEGDFRK